LCIMNVFNQYVNPQMPFFLFFFFAPFKSGLMRVLFNLLILAIGAPSQFSRGLQIFIRHGMLNRSIVVETFFGLAPCDIMLSPQYGRPS
jgi:hypothetical protein